MDSNLFYSVLAAATATLLGLLFIAVQPNIDLLFNGSKGHWKALALSTFQTYSLILAVSLFAFVPLLRMQALLVACALGIWRQSATWLPEWRLSSAGRFSRLRETFWLLIGPVSIYLWLVFLAFHLVHGKGSEGTETNIAVALIILLFIVLRNSWRLLIQIPSEQSRKEKSG